MSGKTNEQTKLNPEVQAEASHNSLITATNNSLVLSDGLNLAIINKDGKVIQQGSDVSSSVFEAMSKTVILRFCDRFATFTEADFKPLR